MNLINETIKETKERETHKAQSQKREAVQHSNSKSVEESNNSNLLVSLGAVSQMTTVQINRIIQSLKQGQEQKQRIIQTIQEDEAQEKQYQKHQNPKIIPFKVGAPKKERGEYYLYFREELEAAKNEAKPQMNNS